MAVCGYLCNLGNCVCELTKGCLEGKEGGGKRNAGAFRLLHLKRILFIVLVIFSANCFYRSNDTESSLYLLYLITSVCVRICASAMFIASVVNILGY